MRRTLSRFGIAVLTILAFLLPTYGVSGLHAAPAHRGVSAGLLTFDTTLSGMASDGKHMVTMNVNKFNLGSSSVYLTITVYNGTGLTAALNAGTYDFTLPAADLVVGKGAASLDTHNDLGKYGHISAQWTFTVKSEPLGTGNCVPSFGGPSTVPHIIATGSATFSLNFPCEGSVSGQLHGTNIDQYGSPASTSGSTSQTPKVLPSPYFSGATAEKKTSKGTVNISAFTFSSLGTRLIVSINSPSNSSVIGLTSVSHGATDTLSQGSLTIGTNPAAVLHYRGSLGSADITWMKSSKPPFTFSTSGSCLSNAVTGLDKTARIAFSSQQTTVSGSANLTACTAARVTFGPGDTGSVFSTSKSTGTNPGPGSNPGSGISSGGFSVTKISPADGATGVPTNTSITVTFSSAPATGKVEMLLTEANNPAGLVLLPPATVNAGSKSASSTPSTPLKPNTKYKLTIIGQGSSGGFATSTAYFTTGS